MMKGRSKVALYAIFLIALFFSGCSKAEKEDAAKVVSTKPHFGGRLIRATSSDPKSFNIILAKETSTTGVISYLFEGLTTTNGITTDVEPQLAHSWDRSPDGKSWLFHLRDDVKWSDGKPFTADDVVFTFRKLIFNKDIPNSMRDIFTIEGKEITVEKVDDYTVRFTLPTKFAPFLRSMSAPILPKHILEEYVDKGSFNSVWGVDTDPENIIGTGPFMLDKYTSGQMIKLKRNPLYWKKNDKGENLPYLDGIVFLIVQNQDVGFLKFQEGEIDYFDMRGSDYPQLKPKEKEGNFTVYRAGPSFGTNFIVFNQNTTRNPDTQEHYIPSKKLSWFTNDQFRRAVAHVVDKQSIIDIVFNGLGYPQVSPVSPSEGFFFTDDVPTYEYNIEKAKDILQEAGFSDRNGDGIIEDSDGNDVEFTILTNPGSTERVKIAEIVRKDLEKLGFKVQLSLIEFNTMVSKLTSTYNWDCVIMGLTGSIEPHFGNNVWQSSGHLHVWNPKQKEPKTEWEIEIDEIFNQGVQEFDRNKRKELYDQWQRLVAQYVPLIYTVLPESLFAVRNKFGNLHPTPYGGPFHNIEEIYVIEEKQ
ncbi:MAG: ABC transporter substrate-binding protein [Candidatus Ancaeobacter aquaticus]|nr:ABC transporter substrate-binding protein [Candidatus Ancaeobacter aquaticus]